MAYFLESANAASNCVLYVTEGKAGMRAVLRILDEAEYPEFNHETCGVVSLKDDFCQTSLTTQMVRFLKDLAGETHMERYETVTFLPNPDYSGLLYLKEALVEIVKNHPATIEPKVRVALSPLFVPRHQNNDDEYYNVPSTVGVETFMGLGLSHDYVSDISFLNQPRLVRLLQSSKAVSGDWRDFLNRRKHNDGRMDRVPDDLTAEYMCDFVFEPARQNRAHPHMLNIMDGLTIIYRKAIHYLKYMPGRRGILRDVVNAVYSYAYFSRYSDVEETLLNCLAMSHGKLKMLEIPEVGVVGIHREDADYYEVQITQAFQKLCPFDFP